MGVLLAFLISVLFTSPVVLGPVFAIIILLDLVGGIPPRRIATLMKGLLVLALLSVIMWPIFFKSGNVIWTAGRLSVTDAGVYFGLAMAFRILIMVLSSTTLMFCTSQQDLVLGLHRLGVPYKACFAFATGFRFLPTMVGVTDTIMEAQKARGLDLERGGVLKRLKNYAAILAPMIIESIRVAQQLALSIEIRGFDARPRRTTLRDLRFLPGDQAALAFMGLLFVAAIAVRVAGYGVIPGR